MNAQEEQQLYRAALSKWGEDSQVNCLIEERAELIDAIQKRRRGRVQLYSVIEEMVDVGLMLNQMRILFAEAAPLYSEIKERKLERLRLLLIQPTQEVKRGING